MKTNIENVLEQLTYVAPRVRFVEVKTAGVICNSPDWSTDGEAGEGTYEED